jgi:hypothetical protein
MPAAESRTHRLQGSAAEAGAEGRFGARAVNGLAVRDGGRVKAREWGCALCAPNKGGTASARFVL